MLSQQAAGNGPEFGTVLQPFATASPIEPCPSAVARMSVPEPSAPTVVHGTPVAAMFQVDCISFQFLSSRLALNTASGPQNLKSESVAEVMVAPLGTGPPSDWKMLKRTSPESVFVSRRASSVSPPLLVFAPEE